MLQQAVWMVQLLLCEWYGVLLYFSCRLLLCERYSVCLLQAITVWTILCISPAGYYCMNGTVFVSCSLLLCERYGVSLLQAITVWTVRCRRPSTLAPLAVGITWPASGHSSTVCHASVGTNQSVTEFNVHVQTDENKFQFLFVSSYKCSNAGRILTRGCDFLY